MTDVVVTIFVEGDTDYEFYQRLVAYLHKQRGGILHCKVKYKNLKGSGNYQDEADSYFKKQIVVTYPDRTHIVALCYDTDVSERLGHDPINWRRVEKRLRHSGADRIIHVKAEHTIEDWIMVDKEGIKRFLRLPKKTKLSNYSGLGGLKKLFRLAEREYEKGEKCEGLINAFDVDLIINEIHNDIIKLLEAIR